MLTRRLRTAHIELQEARYQSNETMPTHAHPEACVTLVLRGSLQERAGTRSHAADPMFIGVKPHGLEHSDRFLGSARTMKIRFSRGFTEDLEEWSPALETWRWRLAGPATRVMTRMLVRLRSAVPVESGWLEDDALELVSELGGDRRLTPQSAPPAWLKQLKGRVETDFREGVRTSELAREVGLHPVYLARLFRQHFGESISGCVRRARTRAAAHLLADTNEPIARIALRTGCSDQSHLTRLFKSVAGLTPDAWRRISAT